jgi:glutathione S-transferase
MKLHLLLGCPFAHRATIALREKGLAFEPRLFERGARPPELEAAGSYARSPTLFDGVTVVWDSLIVLDYLEDRYPERPLLPRDAAGRAHARMLVSRVGAEILPKLGAVTAEVVFKPTGTSDPAKVDEAVRGFTDATAAWDAQLAGKDFLLGPLGVADIVLFTPFAAIQRLVGWQVPAERPHLRAWLARMTERPSTPLVTA